MPARITDEIRAGIRAAVVDPADTRSRAELARAFGIAPSSVGRIAAEAGAETPWDTSGTREATVAARDRLKAKRAALSERFLDEAERALDRLRGPWEVYAFGGKDNEFNSRVLADVPAADLRNVMTSAAVAFDKHLAADKHDAHDEADEGISMIGKLADGLDAAYRRLTASETSPSTPTTDEEVEPA